MSDITEKCKQIIQELDNNIKNPEDLEFAKNQVYNLLEEFLQEVEVIQESAERKIEKLVQNQIDLDRRISGIESDIYGEDDGEMEIICPYCNHEFILEHEEIKDEIICPECNNTIELDWHDNHSCSCCDEECDDCGDECDCEDCDEDYDDDDDM